MAMSKGDDETVVHRGRCRRETTKLWFIEGDVEGRRRNCGSYRAMSKGDDETGSWRAMSKGDDETVVHRGRCRRETTKLWFIEGDVEGRRRNCGSYRAMLKGDDETVSS